MKKTMVLMSLGMLFVTAGLCAARAQDNQQEGPGFELYNKSGKNVWIAVINGSEYVTEQVKPGFARQVSIDISKPTTFGIWTTEPVSPHVTFDLLLRPRIVPTPAKVYKFDAGKTIYVTWDQENRIRPQTGPLKGFLGTTDSGLKLNNNVRPENIRLASESTK